MTVKAAVAPGLPESTLNADKLDQLKRLAEGLTPAELYWVAAWSASLAAQAQQGGATTAASPTKQAAATLTIVYGSQTGNAKRLAEQPVWRHTQQVFGIRANLKNLEFGFT